MKTIFFFALASSAWAIGKRPHRRGDKRDKLNDRRDNRSWDGDFMGWVLFI
jgi:hypothetical protein